MTLTGGGNDVGWAPRILLSSLPRPVRAIPPVRRQLDSYADPDLTEQRFVPITEDVDGMYFGEQAHDDQIGLLEGVRSRFGRTFAGEPDRIATELAADEAVRAADTVLFTVPNQLGVAYNARILATIAEHIAPAIGWTPAGVTAAA